MKWLLMNPLQTLPPFGLIALGAVVGIAGVPVVKKTARKLAVLSVRGALTVNDAIKGTRGNVKRNWQDIVEQARPKSNEIVQMQQTQSSNYEREECPPVLNEQNQSEEDTSSNKE